MFEGCISEGGGAFVHGRYWAGRCGLGRKGLEKEGFEVCDTRGWTRGGAICIAGLFFALDSLLWPFS